MALKRVSRSDKKEKTMSKKVEEAVIEVKETKIDPKEQFIARKLKAINEMTNKAKARAAADRVIRNARGK